VESQARIGLTILSRAIEISIATDIALSDWIGSLLAREAYIAAMWLMFLRAPGRDTAPGEPVDLGDIGAVREKNWERSTPYSVAVPK
jgi:hypothetical protein